MRRPPIPRPDGRLRFQRVREPFWRWRVWAVYEHDDGLPRIAFPTTRSGFWTRFGAASFAADINAHQQQHGFAWRYEVRREPA